MADLFSTIEPPVKKKKVFYKGKGGLFSDKETARITQIEKENKVLNANCQYWKRQADRLSQDYKTEHNRVLELEEELKKLTNPHPTDNGFIHHQPEKPHLHS